MSVILNAAVAEVVSEQNPPINVTLDGSSTITITNTTDSIAIGTTSQLFTATTVGPKIGLDVNVIGGTITGTFTDASIGTPGSAAPAQATQVGGTDGTNLRTLSTDTTGKLNVLGPLTDTQLRATPVPVSGTVTANQGTSPWVVSGTVTATPTGTQDVNIVSSVEIEIKNDTGNPVPVSGTVTANAGTNLNTSALALESGGHLASIDTKIPSNLTVTSTRLLVDGSGVTQPISAASLPLPTGAATAALQTSGNASLTSIDSKTPALGQALGAASVPVVLTAGQLITLTPLTTVNAKAATPTAGTITQAAITVGTSAVRLTVSGSAPSATRSLMMFTPDSTSTAKFYVGSSSVTSSGANRGAQFLGGDQTAFNNDAGDYYIISDTAAQTVYITEQA